MWILAVTTTLLGVSTIFQAHTSYLLGLRIDMLKGDLAEARAEIARPAPRERAEVMPMNTPQCMCVGETGFCVVDRTWPTVRVLTSDGRPPSLVRCIPEVDSFTWATMQ